MNSIILTILCHLTHYEFTKAWAASKLHEGVDLASEAVDDFIEYTDIASKREW